MRKIPKILLISSVLIFGLGLLDWQESLFWYALRPVGAILLLEYIIFQLLDKEVALFDDEERAKKEALTATAAVRSGIGARAQTEAFAGAAQLTPGTLQKA